ncbi:DMT family transporter [Rheinheimera sp.]|uniref:DMT family transporter n=1 Tax=Rheinheimera sp. TaxID=1869214 RepID=UPI00262A779B|nr:DMT family transporter [Rheinheimera sp.]MCA1930457.1 DMT family transporter [Rheinheimera sp.]
MNNSYRMQQKRQQDDFTGVVYGLLGSCIWGACMAVSSQGLNDGFSSEDLAFLRYLTSGLLLLPLLVLSNMFRKVGWGRSILLTLLGGPVFALVAVQGFSYAPLTHGTVIQAVTLILCSLLVLFWRSKEVPKFSYLAGILVLFIGLAAVAGPLLPAPAGATGLWKGDLLFVAAGLIWALFLTLIWYWQVDALAATVVVAVLSALIYCPLYLLVHGPLRISMLDFDQIIEQLMFQGILSGVLASFAFSKAVHYLGVSKAVLFPAFSPAVTLLFGILLFHQIPALSQWLGFTVVAAGLCLGFYREAD